MQNMAELRSNMDHSPIFIELIEGLSESTVDTFYLDYDLRVLKPGEFQELCQMISKARHIKQFHICRVLSTLDDASIDDLIHLISSVPNLTTLSFNEPRLFVEISEVSPYYKPKKEITKLIYFLNKVQKINSIKSLKLRSNHIAHMDSQHIKLIFDVFMTMTLEELDLSVSFFEKIDGFQHLLRNEYNTLKKQYRNHNPYDAFINHLSVFLKTSNIKTLYFDHNPLDALTDAQFKELMDAIAIAPHLRSLHLYHSHLDNPDRQKMLFRAVGDTPNLVSLNLDGNGFAGCPDPILNAMFDSFESSPTICNVTIDSLRERGTNCIIIGSPHILYLNRMAAFKARIDKLTKEATEAAVVLKEVAGVPNPIINLFLNYCVPDETRRGNILTELDKIANKIPLKLGI